MDHKNNNNNNNRDNRGPRQQGGRRPPYEEKKYNSELIALRRVAKATAGAKRLRFSAVVIIGDKKGKIGIAMGKGLDPQEAMQKAIRKAEGSMITIPLSEGKSVPHRVDADYKAASVLIKPAPIGTGVVAGGAIRKVLEMTGIENVVAKRMGTANSLTNAYCTILALSKLKQVKNGNRSEKVSTK